MAWRAIAVWLLLIAAESIHGALRQAFLAPAIGDMPARRVSVLTGSAIIFLIAWASTRWLGARSFGERMKVGALWTVLTVAFEIGLGRGLGHSWDRLLSDYDLSRGGLMGFGLLVLLFAPALAATARGSR